MTSMELVDRKFMHLRGHLNILLLVVTIAQIAFVGPKKAKIRSQGRLGIEWPEDLDQVSP